MTSLDFTQLGRDNARMQVVFARDIGVPNAHIVHFLKMELYNTVPFRSIGPSRVTGPVVLAEIWCVSRVTGMMDACDKRFR
jgi:hypothetical protein